MNRIPHYAIDYYNKEVVSRIIDKYDYEPIEAVRSFLMSETHGLLEDEDNGLCAYPARAVFDMWEAERITGDPRNCVSLRGE